MTACKHAALELLPERKGKVRCQRCNLTISPEDLGDGFCPECFDSAGVKHYNFDRFPMLRKKPFVTVVKSVARSSPAFDLSHQWLHCLIVAILDPPSGITDRAL